MAVNTRDFPKFMAMFEFLQDPEQVQKHLKEVIKETKAMQAATKELAVAKSKSHGITTYEEGMARLAEQTDTQAARQREEEATFNKSRKTANDQLKQREDIVTKKERAFDARFTEKSAQLAEREKRIVAIEEANAKESTRIDRANAKLSQDKAEWSEKLKVLKSVSL